MNKTRHHPRAWGALSAMLLVASATHARAGSADILERAGVAGGLMLQVGCDDVSLALAAARTGRFLVQLVDADSAKVEAARRRIHAAGLYGLASAVPLESATELPLPENFVNLLVVESGAGKLDPSELRRVLAPNGSLWVSRGGNATGATGASDGSDASDGDWTVTRKPWPKSMDEWSHARHGADGNAVSRDKLVGPPRRVRWVTGPAQEISNMVSAGGRNYYGGLITRDSFNGLRLWERDLSPSPARGGYSFRGESGGVPPVATGDGLLVVTNGVLQSLDAATGRVLRTFPAAGAPVKFFVSDGLLVTRDKSSVRALDLESGELAWTFAASSPEHVVAGKGAAYFVQGDSRRGQNAEVVSLSLASGRVRWRRSDMAWAGGARRCVYQDDLLVFEVSSFNDDKKGNEIVVVSAKSGRPLWRRSFVPGMTHKKQARALFAGSYLWVLANGECVAFDKRTGKPRKRLAAGDGHCFPPVATDRFLFAGELDATDLSSGAVDTNRITKGACSRDAGFVLANGLVYTFPKHCVCWPMLRGYTALAPQLRDREQEIRRVVSGRRFPISRAEFDSGSGSGSDSDSDSDWPCYRADVWRSSSSTTRLPRELEVLWRVSLGKPPGGVVALDWRDNPFVKGALTSPVIAGGLVVVARPDVHEVIGIDESSGRVVWRATADGRVDSSPTLVVPPGARRPELCLFGTRGGTVFCLRASDGARIWRRRAAPLADRIVSYGQLESPWPVPGSVLVANGTAFFAAGRQPLADGGIFVFAADARDGSIRWVERLNDVPTKNYYGASGLEFDAFDLLHREGDDIAMSRWLFDRDTGTRRVEPKSGFARLSTGAKSAMVPRGAWSYAPRHEDELDKTRPFRRPLVAFRENVLFGCSQDRRTIYRRDFALESGEKFDANWYSKGALRKQKAKWRSDRLARGAKWKRAVWDGSEKGQSVAALVWAGDVLAVGGSAGGLRVLSIENGATLARFELPRPVWDGMAAARGRLFVSTVEGELVCLGKKGGGFNSGAGGR